MSRRPLSQGRPNQYFELGQRGRKTGWTIPRVEKDADGYDDMESYFIEEYYEEPSQQIQFQPTSVRRRNPQFQPEYVPVQYVDQEEIIVEYDETNPPFEEYQMRIPYQSPRIYPQPRVRHTPVTIRNSNYRYQTPQFRAVPQPPLTDPARRYVGKTPVPTGQRRMPRPYPSSARLSGRYYKDNYDEMDEEIQENQIKLNEKQFPAIEAPPPSSAKKTPKSVTKPKSKKLKEKEVTTPIVEEVADDNQSDNVSLDSGDNDVEQSPAPLRSRLGMRPRIAAEPIQKETNQTAMVNDSNHLDQLPKFSETKEKTEEVVKNLKPAPKTTSKKVEHLQSSLLNSFSSPESEKTVSDHSVSENPAPPKIESPPKAVIPVSDSFESAKKQESPQKPENTEFGEIPEQFDNDIEQSYGISAPASPAPSSNLDIEPNHEPPIIPTDSDSDIPLPQKPTKEKKSKTKTKTKSKEVKKPRINGTYISSSTDKGIHRAEESAAEGIRKSKRTRVEPVAYWKNEKVVYKRRDSGIGGPGIADVIRVSDDEGYSISKKKKKSSNSKEKDDLQPKVPTEAKVLNYATKMEEFQSNNKFNQEIAVTPDMLVTSRTVGAGNYSFQKVFSEGEFIASGVLDLPLDSKKPIKNSHNSAMIFVVLKGRVEVQVHDTTFELIQGGQFFVPRGLLII